MDDVAPDVGATMDDGDTRWLTYDALAAALNIAPDSARRLVARRRWARQSSNDGRTLVAVPVDRLPDSPPDIAEDIPPHIGQDIGTDIQEDVRPDTLKVEDLLREQVADLRMQLDELRDQARADIERERVERINVQDRAITLADQVADVARQLAQAVQDAGERERGLRDRAEAAEVALVEARSRPWWKRLAG